MSPESTSQISEMPSAPTLVPPGDHRKRRRNRTTQSCLNCHASKRMCDRKRPACQRCTTLGLTGLCVYEVDDPSQRATPADEKVLLRKRVAELEGVIREMKNKPHPRWAQKSSASQPQCPQSIEDDIPFVAEPSRAKDDGGNKSTLVNSFPEKNHQMNTSGVQLTSASSASRASMASESPVTPQDSHFPGTFNLPAPPSSSSLPSLVYSHRTSPRVAVDDHRPVNPAVFNNVDNLLATACFEPTGFDDGIYGHMLDRILQADRASSMGSCNRDTPCSQSGSNCGCINDPTVYSSLLELSVRLRKAVELLSTVSDHDARAIGSGCQLYQRVRDLDKLTSSTLGNTTSPVDRYGAGDQYLPPLPTEFMPSTISPNCLTNTQRWDPVVSRPSGSGSPGDDSFMSWSGIPQEHWPHAARP